jgi:hypothetical protein
LEIDLADAVAVVRSDLLEAASRAEPDELAFVVGPVEMEFAVELRRDAKAKLGFRAWVVSADAEGSLGNTGTHRVTFTLTPVQPDGKDLLVHGRSRPEGPGDVSERVGR